MRRLYPAGEGPRGNYSGNLADQMEAVVARAERRPRTAWSLQRTANRRSRPVTPTSRALPVVSAWSLKGALLFPIPSPVATVTGGPMPGAAELDAQRRAQQPQAPEQPPIIVRAWLSPEDEARRERERPVQMMRLHPGSPSFAFRDAIAAIVAERAKAENRLPMCKAEAATKSGSFEQSQQAKLEVERAQHDINKLSPLGSRRPGRLRTGECP